MSLFVRLLFRSSRDEVRTFRLGLQSESRRPLFTLSVKWFLQPRKPSSFTQITSFYFFVSERLQFTVLLQTQLPGRLELKLYRSKAIRLGV